MLQVKLLIAYLIIDIHNPVCVVISRQQNCPKLLIYDHWPARGVR